MTSSTLAKTEPKGSPDDPGRDRAEAGHPDSAVFSAGAVGASEHCLPGRSWRIAEPHNAAL